MARRSSSIPLHHISHRPTLALMVQHVEQNDLASLLSEPPHRHDLNEIYLVTQGHSQQVIDEQEYRFSVNTLGLITKGQIHDVLAMEDFAMWIVFFDSDVLADPQLQVLRHSLFNLQVPHQFQLSPEQRQLIEPLFRSMETVHNDQSHTYTKTHLLQHYLCTLLWHIESLKQQHTLEQSQQKTEHYELCQTFLSVLETYFAKEHGVQFYAQHLGISSRQLSEITKITLGKTAKELIEERLSLEARRILRYTDTNIQSICYQLGFEDPSYFTRFFKRQNDRTPLDFRNSVN